jgi:type II restriction enzyme
MIQNKQILSINEFLSAAGNELQAAISELFLPRFAKGGKILHLIDSSRSTIVSEKKILNSLGISDEQIGMLPSVVIYDDKRNWLFLIEAGSSQGPINEQRLIELDGLLKSCKVGKIYVTAFTRREEFVDHLDNIAWETEVWMSDVPDHMVHLNGDRFMGPR